LEAQHQDLDVRLSIGHSHDKHDSRHLVRLLHLVSSAFTLPGLALAYDITYDTLLATVARRDRLDAAITEMAAESAWPGSGAHGGSTLTAFGLAVEIGDWQRLTGRSIGAYLGLVPTESSSGASR
jgi:transposase